ncbi:MAG: hypothetical protein LBQ75_05800 [Zoogloeaceae bacterium]|jgi:hypothetical protein|nr:hypothetical protein [Zoogloeaceae bacterium]
MKTTYIRSTLFLAAGLLVVGAASAQNLFAKQKEARQILEQVLTCKSNPLESDYGKVVELAKTLGGTGGKVVGGITRAGVSGYIYTFKSPSPLQVLGHEVSRIVIAPTYGAGNWQEAAYTADLTVDWSDFAEAQKIHPESGLWLATPSFDSGSIGTSAFVYKPVGTTSPRVNCTYIFLKQPNF